MRVEALRWVQVARIAARTSALVFFFGCKTRDERRTATADAVALKASFQASEEDWDQSPVFADFSRAVKLALASRLRSPRANLFRQFHAENATHYLRYNRIRTQSCAVPSSAHSLGSNPELAIGCYARGGSNSQRRPPSSVRGGSGAAPFAAAPAILCFAVALSAAPAILRAKALFRSGAHSTSARLQ